MDCIVLGVAKSWTWLSDFNFTSVLAWEIPWTEGAWWAMVPGVPKSRIRLRDSKQQQQQQWFRNKIYLTLRKDLLVAQMIKSLPSVWETWVWPLGQDDPLEKEMATYSSTLAWKIPWMKEPGSLQSMGSQRVGHNWVTCLSFSLRELKDVLIYNS